ncbi:carbohydrate kinase [Streptomyces sp. SID5785]|uniref:PfkB family carbohydrate kinase n=1 Tax=Streptomyces sp. SID5785 TaxID=2690309 RepID=UPI0013611096|nr:carbohydrate kinase [Streptomyces sp. SID5785]
MIVVAGEALIDLVPQLPSSGDAPGPQHPALAALTPRLGGGPYNTAVALGRLGSPVAFCSRVSRDAFGEALLGGLREAGVDVAPVQRGDEPTTLAVASIGADGSAGYSFYVEGTADRLFTTPPTLPEGTRAVSFGTCSLVLEPGATAYEELMRSAAASGVFTALDPNIRAGLIPDADAYRARFTSWLPSTSLLKLSEEDAQWLGGTPQEWLAAGPSAVVMTRGGAGLTVYTRGGGTHSVPGEHVDVVDTIGAGDTVNAALLHGLSSLGALSPAGLGRVDGDGWGRLLRFAARAAALTCSRAGAEPPYSTEIGAL